jgi:hypothetical protein
MKLRSSDSLILFVEDESSERSRIRKRSHAWASPRNNCANGSIVIVQPSLPLRDERLDRFASPAGDAGSHYFMDDPPPAHFEKYLTSVADPHGVEIYSYEPFEHGELGVSSAKMESKV